MKRFSHLDYLNTQSRLKVKREPLYTLEEIADRLGVNYGSLVDCMKGRRVEGYPPPPESVMLTGNGSTVRMAKKLYKLSEFKKWLRDLREFNINRQGGRT